MTSSTEVAQVGNNVSLSLCLLHFFFQLLCSKRRQHKYRARRIDVRKKGSQPTLPTAQDKKTKSLQVLMQGWYRERVRAWQSVLQLDSRSRLTHAARGLHSHFLTFQATLKKGLSPALVWLSFHGFNLSSKQFEGGDRWLQESAPLLPGSQHSGRKRRAQDCHHIFWVCLRSKCWAHQLQRFCQLASHVETASCFSSGICSSHKTPCL